MLAIRPLTRSLQSTGKWVFHGDTTTDGDPDLQTDPAQSAKSVKNTLNTNSSPLEPL